MSNAGFGEHLKREREMRGVSLDEICAATRIGTRFLNALETEDWEQLPGGVFNRGFVRAVARFLGLDEDSMVAECVLAMNENNAATVTPGQHVMRRDGAAHERGMWWIGATALLVLAVAGWLGWHWYAGRRTQRNEAPPVAAAPVNPGAQSDGTTAAGAAMAASGNTATPANGMLQLKIEAGKATALAVTADGAKVFDGSVIAGQSRSFEAQQEFTVKVQDAGAILLELNGQTLPPAGPPGRPGSVTLTRRDLKPVGGFD